MSIPPLIGANYPQWREKINMSLVILRLIRLLQISVWLNPLSLTFPMTLVLMLRQGERRRIAST
jgi:hypothetical protein